MSHRPSVVGDIQDNEAWYDDANDDVIDYVVAIPTPNPHLCAPADNRTAPLRPCILEDVNKDIDPYDDYKPTLFVRFSTEDHNQTDHNATLKIRGGFSRQNPQKSYTLKLESKTSLLYKQRKFQLVKSFSDPSRMRNKLMYDLLRTVPHITSLKTQFVHLFIDEEDYGLYTQIEAYREEFLINRGWNDDDRLYNSVNMFFDGWALENTAVDEDGKPKDETKFSEIVEIKSGKDHRKLQEMLHAVNSDKDINAVIDKYFNRENYLTWLAINLVINNKDTIQHNFYLYNPVHSNTFYFMPWDYDGAWSPTEYLAKYEYGISVWWESKLHRKFLSDPHNREALYARAEQLRVTYFTDAALQERIDAYAGVVEPFQEQAPDGTYNSPHSWQKWARWLVDGIPQFIELYKSVIGHPMPFHERAHYDADTRELKIEWDPSVDLEGDPIVYDLYVATDPDMNSTLLHTTDLQALSHTFGAELPSGDYFVKVIAKEAGNPTHYQEAFERVETEEKEYYGVLQFHVESH